MLLEQFVVDAEPSRELKYQGAQVRQVFLWGSLNGHAPGTGGSVRDLRHDIHHGRGDVEKLLGQPDAMHVDGVDGEVAGG